jgi:hypothetical protein
MATFVTWPLIRFVATLLPPIYVGHIYPRPFTGMMHMTARILMPNMGLPMVLKFLLFFNWNNPTPAGLA